MVSQLKTNIYDKINGTSKQTDTSGICLNWKLFFSKFAWSSKSETWDFFLNIPYNKNIFA